jgi:hypothetical protein
MQKPKNQPKNSSKENRFFELQNMFCFILFHFDSHYFRTS